MPATSHQQAAPEPPGASPSRASHRLPRYIVTRVVTPYACGREIAIPHGRRDHFRQLGCPVDEETTDEEGRNKRSQPGSVSPLNHHEGVMQVLTSVASRHPRRFTGVALVLGTVALAVILAHAPAQGGNSNPGVIPPHAKFRGLSYGEWAARWWSTVLSIPVKDGEHPVLSGGAFPGDKGVLFLAGKGGAAAILDITIPPGTPLFFPVVNAECSVLEPDPFHGDDEAELRACANGHIDNTSGLFATIDGTPVSNLDAYRVESPLFEFGPLPEDNLFAFFGLDAPPGTTSPAVDAGVYLLLAPLSVGKHVVSFGGTFDLQGFSIDTTYNITVAAEKEP
jgi:hypothetical protein